ncbi:hypothetical protein bcgnr5378_06970 [Bacillus cereus]|uniref:Uncharacterized protein n=1 Tax=Bacillus cereus TaxID=1396 RepID=A0A164NX23_BACCE|nr:hypothetical protein [Bacillus cereus]KZD65953.1 hypothetical protein B4088_2710 [Bacillus cereus]
MNEDRLVFDRIEGKLIFGVLMDNHHFQQEVAISCGEDMEEYMQMYFKKDWAGLFSEYFINVRDIYDVSFEGIHMSATETEKNHSTNIQLLNNQRRASVKFDRNTLVDDNAEKIKKIREIINL